MDTNTTKGICIYFSHTLSVKATWHAYWGSRVRVPHGKDWYSFDLWGPTSQAVTCFGRAHFFSWRLRRHVYGNAVRAQGIFGAAGRVWATALIPAPTLKRPELYCSNVGYRSNITKVIYISRRTRVQYSLWNKVSLILRVSILFHVTTHSKFKEPRIPYPYLEGDSWIHAFHKGISSM